MSAWLAVLISAQAAIFSLPFDPDDGRCLARPASPDVISLSAVEQSRQCNALKRQVMSLRGQDEDQSVDDQLKGIEAKSWTAFYMVAAALVKAGRSDEAGLWFYVGQLRGRINVSCMAQDPTGGPAALASLNSILGVPINEYLGASPDTWATTIQRALDWDESHGDRENASKACEYARQEQRNGLAVLREHILSHKDEIRTERTKNGLRND